MKEKLLFGNEPTPELIAILLVYVVHGILELTRLAVSFFLKDELGLSPAEVAGMMGITILPWTVKPLFGFMSDGLPIFGYRRRPYIVLSGLLGASAWIALATVVHTAWAATAAIALNALSGAISDVIADALIVELAREKSQAQAASLQSLSKISASVGGLIAAYLSGALLEHLSTHTLFAISAAFPLIISAVAWLIPETPLSDGEKPSLREQVGQLKGAIAQKSIWLPTAFILLWQSTPTSNTAFFYFNTNELGFQPEFLGRVQLLTSIASLLGIWLFQRYFTSVPFRTIFTWSMLLSTLLGMTPLLLVTHANRSLGIDDQWFSLGDSAILTVMGKIAQMPVWVLAARLCPVGVEATLFAAIMSVYNLGGSLSSSIGAVLTDWLGITQHNFDKLWLLVLIANFTRLIPLPFLGWLPDSDEETNSQAVPELEPANSNVVGEHFVPDLLSELAPTDITPAKLTVNENR